MLPIIFTMLFETYLEQLKQEGAALPTMVMQEVNKVPFEPKFVCTPTNSGRAADHVDDRIAWLNENHPTAKVMFFFGGVDWAFEDEFVAMCFKLRWS